MWSYGLTPKQNEVMKNTSIISESGSEDWEYGNPHILHYEINDALARDIRKRINVSNDAKIVLITKENWDGYSEYTQENYYEFIISVDEINYEFGSYSSSGAMDRLLEWLDEED